MLPWKEFCILLAIIVLFNVLLGCTTLGILYLTESQSSEANSLASHQHQ
jgi:predicted small lipoprotein YifL